MTKKNVLFIAMLFGLILLSACAGPNTVVKTPSSDGSVAGFWWGLWNGITAPFAFIGSLFSSKIHFYEVHNNGGWYNFGFVLGAGILFGGGGKAS
jgi:hypothetical protein